MSLQKAFGYISTWARRTPLRKSRWAVRLHSYLFSKLPRTRAIRFMGREFRVDPRDKKRIVYGFGETYVAQVLERLAVPGTTAVDVGANVGLHTVGLAERVGEQGRVMAFEPDPDNYALLRLNLSDHAVSNVEAHRVALSDEAGDALLYQSAYNRGALSMHRENIEAFDGYAAAPVAIRTARADEFLAGLDRPVSVVKIDVEGAEPLVLAGMRRTLAANPRVGIVFELHPSYVERFGVDPGEFLEGLERDGFALSRLDEDAERLVAMSAGDLLRLARSSDYRTNVLASRGYD